jgi:hypothetical protein
MKEGLYIVTDECGTSKTEIFKKDKIVKSKNE